MSINGNLNMRQMGLNKNNLIHASAECAEKGRMREDVQMCVNTWME